MAGNNKQIIYSAETDSVPRSIVAPGTIKTVNGLGTKVVGVGTTFIIRLPLVVDQNSEQ